MAEDEYYDNLKKFIIENPDIKCNSELVWIDKFISIYKPNILGIRKLHEENRIGRKYEVVAIKVIDNQEKIREGWSHVLDYTKFADRCYLALRSESEIDNTIVYYAKKMGIGLIQIINKIEIKLILKSKNHYSNPSAIRNFLFKKDGVHRAICRKCQDVLEFEEKHSFYTFGDSIKEETSYHDIYDDFDLCKKCVGKLKKELKKTFECV